MTWKTSGKARPMPSASATGSPIRAAQATGTRPLPPPISPAMSAATRRPVSASIWSRSRSPSFPFSIFSMLTVGAPMPPHGMIIESSASSSRSTSGTGPKSSMACSACSSAEVGVSAAARAEHGTAAGERAQRPGIKKALHDKNNDRSGTE